MQSSLKLNRGKMNLQLKSKKFGGVRIQELNEAGLMHSGS